MFSLLEQLSEPLLERVRRVDRGSRVGSCELLTGLHLLNRFASRFYNSNVAFLAHHVNFTLEAVVEFDFLLAFGHARTHRGLICL